MARLDRAIGCEGPYPALFPGGDRHQCRGKPVAGPRVSQIMLRRPYGPRRVVAVAWMVRPGRRRVVGRESGFGLGGKHGGGLEQPFRVGFVHPGRFLGRRFGFRGGWVGFWLRLPRRGGGAGGVLRLGAVLAARLRALSWLTREVVARRPRSGRAGCRASRVPARATGFDGPWPGAAIECAGASFPSCRAVDIADFPRTLR